jgi:hypothetical protein
MSREPVERSGSGGRAGAGAGAGGGGAGTGAGVGPDTGTGGGGRPAEPPRSGPAARGDGNRHAAVDLVLMLVAFALCSAIAGLAGAPNLGTALTFGQIGFALAAVYVVLRR